jgi:hypothetical protein
LGRIGAAAVEPLVEALDQKDLVALHGAILALGRVWDQGADGELTLDEWRLHTLTSDVYLVRRTIAKAVLRGDLWLPTEPSKPLPLILGVEVVDVWNGQRANRVPELAPETTNAVIDALTKVLRDPALRSKVAQPESDEHRQVRDTLCSALRVLEFIGSPRAIDVLMEVLPAQELGGSAATALGRIQDPQSVDRLIQALQRPATRIWAAYALGAIGDPRAIEPLEAALKHTAEGWPRETVTKALAKLKGKKE